MQKLSLSDPEFVNDFLNNIRIKEYVSYNFNGCQINYVLYEYNSLDDPVGFYDEDGNVFISKSLYNHLPQHAHLIAYHETKEIEHKKQGIQHSEAHQKAYVSELEKAGAVLNKKNLKAYLGWRLSGYPRDKIQNKNKAAEKLTDLALQHPYPYNQVLKAITDLGL